MPWYIPPEAPARAGRRSPRRDLAERVLGPNAVARLVRRLTLVRADINRLARPAGRASTRRLDGMRDRHRGERCVIIGNGPSLNETDLALLSGQATFGLNRIYLMYDRLGFTPTYHVVVNSLVVEQCADELVDVPSPLFTTWPN